MARSEMQSLGQLAAQVVAKGDPSGPGPVATLGQGDGPQAQSPRRGRKESPRDPVATSSEARDGEPVQLELFGNSPLYVGPVSKHPLFVVWQSMRQRCCNPNNEKFLLYGARGITVCPEWQASSRTFVAWALSNGWRPGLQIDRIDNDGPYSPGNCRFVTRSMNRLNLRVTIRLADGRPAVPVARLYGISPDMLRDRVKRRGWTPEQAVGIAPPPERRSGLRLSDGRAAWAVAQANGLSAPCFYDRLRRGWSPDQAAGIAPPPERSCKLRLADGRPARSVALANGVPSGTFTARVRSGWSLDQAAGIAPPPERRSVRRSGLRLSDGRAAWAVAQANGLSAPCFYHRLRRGWSPDQAAGIAPPPERRCKLRLADGRPALSVALANGVPRGTFTSRVCYGWTPDQAAGIAPPPQRRQKAAGRAQPASDGRRRRKTDKPASQPAPGRCEATKQKRGTQDA